MAHVLNHIFPWYFFSFSEQVFADFILLFLSNIAGIFSHYPNEAARRKAFLETRQCIVTRINTQRENQQQVGPHAYFVIINYFLKFHLEYVNFEHEFTFYRRAYFIVTNKLKIRATTLGCEPRTWLCVFYKNNENVPP